MDLHTRPEWHRSALLTIDLQRDFLSEGPHAIPGTSEILPAVGRLASAFRAAGRPVVHAVRLYLPDGSNADLSRRSLLASGARVVAPHSAGSQLAEGLAPSGAPELDPELLLSGAAQPLSDGASPEYAMYKPRWSAFYDTSLLSGLSDLDVSTVVIAGCNYPNCPRSTLVDATERDLRTVAVSDALSRWTAEAPAELSGLGIGVFTTAEVVAGVNAPPR